MRISYLHGLIGTPPEAPILSALDGAGLDAAVLHLPGFSGTEPDPSTRTIADWTFALSAAIDDAGVTGAPILATSVGAMVALELAAIRPEAFSQIVAVAPLGLWDEADPIADPFAVTLSAQRRLLTTDPTVTAPFFDDPDDLSGDALIEHGVSRYQTRTAAASLVWPIPEFGLAQRIHRVSTPVTILWGADDQLAPPSYLDRFAQSLPNMAGTHIVEEAGHLADWDQPVAVAEATAKALAGR